MILQLHITIDMPFKSKKQRDFLKINEPEVYNKWKGKYGVKPRKGGGTLKKGKSRGRKK